MEMAAKVEGESLPFEERSDRFIKAVEGITLGIPDEEIRGTFMTYGRYIVKYNTLEGEEKHTFEQDDINSILDVLADKSEQDPKVRRALQYVLNLEGELFTRNS